MTSLKNHMRLKCVGKQFQCDVCYKTFNNYSVMVVHKRIHFVERPYKCVNCEDIFNVITSLNSQFKFHKQQKWYNYDNEEFCF